MKMGERYLLTLACIFGLSITMDQSFIIMGKQSISIVFMGSPDSGKDDITRHLILKTAGASKFDKIKVKLEQHKTQFLMDELRSESAKQEEIILHKFETERYFVTMIDDGHQNFMDRLTMGTVKVDGAVLVISAVPGEFEDSMGGDRQFPKNAQLAHSLGIKQLIVCVNKMDCADVVYSEGRFNEIQKEVEVLLKHVGYDTKSVQFLPTTSFPGENIFEPSDKMTWWKGCKNTGKRTLFKALDLIEPAHDSTNLPQEMAALDAQKIRVVRRDAVGFPQQSVTASPKWKNRHPGPDGIPAGSVRFGSYNPDTDETKHGLVDKDNMQDPTKEVK